jgi:hypothetical protein
LEIVYIEPGSPWENGFAESFFKRFRDELLNCEKFVTLAEARWFAKRRQEEHNHDRPHSSLGYQTPAEFAAAASAAAGYVPAFAARADRKSDQTRLRLPPDGGWNPNDSGRENFADQHDFFDQDRNDSQEGGKQVDPVNFCRLTTTGRDPNDDGRRQRPYAAANLRVR